MTTIKDIATKLGISTSTVSKGINGASDISEQMRQLVLDTALEMGYIPKSMKDISRRKICILIENMSYENIDQFGYEIIEGFKRAASKKHMDVTIIPTNLSMKSSRRYDSFMLKNSYSGAFFLGLTLHDDYMAQLIQTRVPTVLLDNQIAGNPNVAYIGTENQEGIDAAVSHLAELGHKKIAFLNGTEHSMVTEERQNAFRSSMESHGLIPDENLIRYGCFLPDCAKDHVPGFLEHGATAVMCASDLIASGVINEAARLGYRVPEDISVIGFDDLPIAQYLSPPLTTIRQDRTALGQSALLVLDSLINDLSISKLLLRPKFIVRGSTGPCKAK